MISSYRHVTLANHGKVDELITLFPAYREALGGWSALMHRELLAGEPLRRRRAMPSAAVPFAHRLSARQLKSAYNMTYAALSSWQALVVGRVRELITGSELPEHRKTVLYRINARRAWWAGELELCWLADDNGELTVCTEKEAEKTPEQAVWLPVSADDLTLARVLVKQAQRRHRFPDLRRVNTVVLDSIVAKPTRAEAATAGGKVGWWVKIATLRAGHPVWVPLATNPYFERQLAGGERRGVVQLHRTRDDHGQPEGVEVSLVLERPDAPARPEGAWLGMDFGLSSALFATSDGQLLGHRMLARLRELDAILAPYTAELQRRGVRLKTDPYYRKLQARIRDFATNEIGRLLNRIAARDGEQAVMGLVVERLDFRGGGLSRRMNRLVARAGRSVLKARLEALTAKHGIAVVEVPAPYTSLECSSCGYVHRSNRRSQTRFQCRFCGKTLHADVNAARVVRSRRSRPTPDHTGPRSRRATLRLLDSRHRLRWGLPAGGAVPGVAGALGQQAA